MSEISPELKRALDTIARLTAKRRADDACAQSNPTKTREEAEAFVREVLNKRILHYTAYDELLDFIYGKTEQEIPKVSKKGDEVSVACVAWEIGGKTGKGKPLPLDIAEAWVDELNREFGAGSHWIEPVPTPPLPDHISKDVD